ncbi:21149_t:CDS:2, partial [Dentiscutata erythropus]
VKTEILLVLSGAEIEDSILALQDLANFEKDKNDELIVNLTTRLSDLTIEQEINNFDNLNNFQILIKDVLDEMQIVNIVLDKQCKYKEGDASDTNEKPPEVPIIKRLNGLNKFGSFFEQQKSGDFNVKDLKEPLEESLKEPLEEVELLKELLGFLFFWQLLFNIGLDIKLDTLNIDFGVVELNIDLGVELGVKELDMELGVELDMELDMLE